MSPSFGSIKDLKQAYSLPPVGNFALEVEFPKTPAWDHCREQFAAKFNETVKGFFYSVRSSEWIVGGGQAEDVASFLLKCEEIIGIGEMQEPYPYSSFSKTTKEAILWVEPSSFWLGCEMKRSILTAFLRCALNYNRSKKNFDEAMFSESFSENKWVKETKSATLRFLFGFTRWTEVPKERTPYTTNKHGWHEEFKALDNVNVRKKLALPEGAAKETSIIGVESLWA